MYTRICKSDDCNEIFQTTSRRMYCNTKDGNESCTYKSKLKRQQKRAAKKSEERLIRNGGKRVFTIVCKDKSCGKIFTSQGGNKKHCGDADERGTCAYKQAALKYEKRVIAKTNDPSKGSIIKGSIMAASEKENPSITGRQKQQQLVDSHNNRVRRTAALKQLPVI